jgi:undecaprenyl-diphosphatase
LIGAESLVVNQGVKRLFKRTRPTTDGEDGLKVRRPMTSSFPSGHSSAAAFAATMLSTWDGKRTWWCLVQCRQHRRR